jgi:hypothetical protein
MALMLLETYKALLAAGVSEEQAEKAASELASYESRLAKIASDLNLLKWMVGFILVITTTLLLKSF